VRDRKSLGNILFAAIIVTSFAAAALWQFYVFVTFSSAGGVVDLQGGRQHLWWAIALGASSCVAAFFALSIFMQHDRHAELHITSPPPSRLML